MTTPVQLADRLRDEDPGAASGAGWWGDVPADEVLLGWAPDPDTDPPDDREAAQMPGELAFALFGAQAAAPPKPGDMFVAGGLSRPGGRAGAGFAAGGAADVLPPGVVLAGLTARAWADSARVSDDELIGIARAFGRLAAWVTAGQLAAVAELVARRDAQVAAGADPHIAEHVSDEVAAALTLTSRAADSLVGFASALERLPATRAALWRGEIDPARARVIADAVSGLDPRHAAAVEAAVITAAARQTTGQLRAAVRQAVLTADPAAADRRQQEAQRDARVETWNEPAGTAALAGRDLPPAEVLAADRRIDALARQLKAGGVSLGMDVLRARVYTALLLGVPLQDLHAQLAATGADPGTGPHDGGPGTPYRAGDQAGPLLTGHAGPGCETGPQAPGGLASPGRETGPQAPGGLASPGGGAVLPLPPVTGTLNLTMPVATWLGGTAPGEVPGFGPVPAGDARVLARLLTATAGSSICLTLTGPGGTAIAHGCTTPRARQAGAGARSRPGSLTITLEPLAWGTCSHQHQSPAYQPPARLQHMITIRQCTCTFPGCRANATRCDIDHTIPYDQGGRTCECNLSPLCRRHHRAKQAHGWRLEQPRPGILVWTLPSRRSYTVRPTLYPGEQGVPAPAGGNHVRGTGPSG